MEKSKERLQFLLQSYLSGTITAEDNDELWAYAMLPEFYQEVEDILPDAFDIQLPAPDNKLTPLRRQTILDYIFNYNADKNIGRRMNLVYRVAGIAATITFIVFGVYFFRFQPKTSSESYNVSDVKPGKVGATLTLSTGKKIRLNEANNGQLAEEAGISVSKTADGKLVYEIKENTTDAGKINTVSTARGETYILVLSDKSKVWLNAASSLTYTGSLNENGKRVVKLTGEAYFEVAKDKKHPFVVESKGQEVEVLGTHFNINNYTDEKAVRTTLLEGSVKVTPVSLNGLNPNSDKERVLKPGQQSVLTEQGIRMTDADLDQVMAWQKGYFSFYDEDITTVMRKLARWYNIDVEYRGQLPEVGFNARIDKYSSIIDVLSILEKSKAVHFNIEGRKVIVSK